jgi:glutamine synthetase
MLAAGIEGINTKTELQPPVEKNVYTLTNQQKKRYGIDPLPESLGHSLSIMEQSDFLRKILGTHIFENFLHVKRKQWDAYRQQITPWEIEKYLHLI